MLGYFLVSGSIFLKFEVNHHEHRIFSCVKFLSLILSDSHQELYHKQKHNFFVVVNPLSSRTVMKEMGVVGSIRTN